MSTDPDVETEDLPVYCARCGAPVTIECEQGPLVESRWRCPRCHEPNWMTRFGPVINAIERAPDA